MLSFFWFSLIRPIRRASRAFSFSYCSNFISLNYVLWTVAGSVILIPELVLGLAGQGDCTEGHGVQYSR